MIFYLKPVNSSTCAKMNFLNLYAILILSVIGWHQTSATLNITNEALDLSKNLIAEIEKKVSYTHMNNVTDEIRAITKIFGEFLNKATKINSVLKIDCNVTELFSFNELLLIEDAIKDKVLIFDRHIVSPFLQTNKKLSDLELRQIWEIQIENNSKAKYASEPKAVTLNEKLSVLHEYFTKSKQGDYISILSYITNKPQDKCMDQSRQYILYNTVFNIALLDALGYGLLQYSYAFYKIINDAYPVVDGDVARKLYLFDNEDNGKEYLAKMKQEEQKFIARNTETLKAAKTYMSSLPRVFYSENANEDLEDNFKTKLRVFQNYIVNEVDMSNDKSCSKDCPHFSHGSQVQGCYDNKICAKQRVCEGKLWNCNEESKIVICPASKENSNIRYDFIDIKKKRIYGKEKKNHVKTNPLNAECKNELVEAKTWLRLPYKCSNCMCICEASDPKTDRYFSLRAAVSDVHLNYVVTGINFVIKNQIIHIRIKQGKILPNGLIENAVSYLSEIDQWKKVDDYKISDANIFEGKDYHMLSWQNRTMYLDELDSINKSHVLTGLRFKSESVDSQSYLKLEIRLTPYDFKTGQLSDERSYWYSNDAQLNDRTELKLDNSVITDPTKPDQYFKFTTNVDVDAGQSTVPHIDKSELKTTVSVPLSGARLFVNEDLSLKLKAFTFDVSPYI